MGNGATREFEDMKNKIGDIERETKSNQKEIQRLNEEVTQRDVEVGRLKENMAKRAAQAPVTGRDVDLVEDLRGRIEVLERDKETKNKQMDDLKAELQRLNQEVERRSKINKQQDEQINHLNDEIKQLRKRLEKREVELALLRSQFPENDIQTPITQRDVAVNVADGEGGTSGSGSTKDEHLSNEQQSTSSVDVKQEQDRRKVFSNPKQTNTKSVPSKSDRWQY
ncbi:TNFAIP3-interacting protein 3-like [Pecten maximus]|uniref:TNFAIP3-interacting protein 3-like n=1 Tax=Pecten maximus TaxID=6579 RepID=UPI001458FC47|nr:TNFAIP3-interacting protein 3-like [Pecten maximus]